MNPLTRSIRRKARAGRRFAALGDTRPNFAVVTAVDVDAQVATVELGSGVTTEVFATGGFLHGRATPSRWCPTAATWW